MKVDLKKLRVRLEQLTGRDFITAAEEEQRSPTVQVQETGLLLRLAAKALDVPVQKLLELPLRDFIRLSTWLGEYFRDTSGESELESSTEESQSA